MVSPLEFRAAANIDVEEREEEDREEDDKGYQETENASHGVSLSSRLRVSSLRSQESGEGSVEAVAEGERLPGVLEAEPGVGGEQSRHEVFIFCGFQRASRVDQSPTSLQAGEGSHEYVSLNFDQGRDLFGREPPACIDAAAQDSGI